MHSVHRISALAGIGSGVLITCNGHHGHERFAEYYILLPRDNCKRFSRRLTSRDEHFTEDVLLNQALSYARDHLQNYVDERYRRHEIPSSLVELIESDDSAIRELRYSSLCEQQMLEIARSTWSTELQELLDQVRRLPVISTTEIE